MNDKTITLPAEMMQWLLNGIEFVPHFQARQLIAAIQPQLDAAEGNVVPLNERSA